MNNSLNSIHFFNQFVTYSLFNNTIFYCITELTSQWALHVESNFDEFPRHFHVLFRRNFAGRIICIVSTHFFWCISMVKKICFVSTYFFLCNFSDRKIHVVSTYFFFNVIWMFQTSRWFPRVFLDVISLVEISTVCLFTFLDEISMSKNSKSFLVSCRLMKTFQEVFLC